MKKYLKEHLSAIIGACLIIIIIAGIVIGSIMESRKNSAVPEAGEGSTGAEDQTVSETEEPQINEKLLEYIETVLSEEALNESEVIDNTYYTVTDIDDEGAGVTGKVYSYNSNLTPTVKIPQTISFYGYKFGQLFDSEDMAAFSDREDVQKYIYDNDCTYLTYVDDVYTVGFCYENYIADSGQIYDDHNLSVNVTYIYYGSEDELKKSDINFGGVTPASDIRDLIAVFGEPTHLDMYELDGKDPYIIATYKVPLSEDESLYQEMVFVFDKRTGDNDGYYLAEVTAVAPMPDYILPDPEYIEDGDAYYIDEETDGDLIYPEDDLIGYDENGTPVLYTPISEDAENNEE